MSALTKQKKFLLRRKHPATRWCFMVLGIDTTKEQVKKYGHDNRGLRSRSRRMEKLPIGDLWDYYERAKANFRKLICIHHPDKGGDAEACGTLTYCWKFLKSWFKKLGIP